MRPFDYLRATDPAAIPQIASTAVLLADKNVQLKAYEREQTKLSALRATHTYPGLPSSSP